ncbi:MAG: phosphohydrolase [Patescibacteria group bacterium]|nr:phosphohydrolase [Patescibacteria group bacterium]
MTKRVLYLIQQASMLLDMPRSHVRNLGNNTPDTIASHCYQVSVIAYCLARMEGLSHEVGLKAMAMGTLHDLAEARTGDMDFVAKNYVKVDEAKAMSDQFAGLPFGQDLLEMMGEYEARESLEAKCVKDADILAQMYIEWVLVWRGNKLAERWFDGDFTNRVPHLRTESAKKLAHDMRDSNPHEWWWSEFVDKGVNMEHLNGKK